MVERRLTGVRVLGNMAKALVLILWFLGLLVLFVEILQRTQYDFVNFRLYSLGIAAAFLLRRPDRQRPLSFKGSRGLWLQTFHESNRDMFFVALAMFTIVFASKDKAISRVFLGTFVATSWILLFVCNLYVDRLLASWIFRGPNNIRSALVGRTATAKQFANWALSRNPMGINTMGLVLTIKSDLGEIELPVLGDAENLGRIIKEHDLNQIILLDTLRSPSWISKVRRVCEEEGCRFLMLNPWQEFFQEPLNLVREGGYSFFTLMEEPLQSPSARMYKKLLDLAVAIPAILFVLLPLAAVVKIMQMIQSPGPLLFKQPRMGRDGHSFNIYKFRSMHVHEPRADESVKQASKEDPRIYPFGRLLRRTSMDEMPNFINVLLGNMSVVGPRPHAISHDDDFMKIVPVYLSRRFVKPGITGLAQVHGYRGEITEETVLRQRIRFDHEYIANWSLGMDIWIILKTIVAVFKPPESAY